MLQEALQATSLPMPHLPVFTTRSPEKLSALAGFLRVHCWSVLHGGFLPKRAEPLLNSPGPKERHDGHTSGLPARRPSSSTSMGPS